MKIGAISDSSETAKAKLTHSVLNLPVDESIALLGLLEEVHEFSLSLSQVKVELLVAVTHWLALVLCQALVGVHDFETHFVWWCV